MDGPPPPPPPHGENPHTTEGEYRKSSDLPPGNYDIFIVPPHSAGSGFLYLPSLQCHRNSFIAGAASTFLVVLIWSFISPAVMTWYVATVSNGNGMGMAVVALGVGVAGWAFGMSQSQPQGDKSNGNNGNGKGGGKRFGGGFSGGPDAGGPNASSQSSNTNYGGGANFGNGPGQQQYGGGGGQHQQQQQGNFGGGANHGHQYAGNQREDSSEPPPKTEKNHGPNGAEWDRTREETKRKEELRRKMEEFKRKREAEAKEKERKREREAMEKELKERREQLEREMAAAKAAAEKEARDRMEKEAAEARAKQEKAAAEAKAEAERLATEAKAEAERLAAEAKAEAERIAAEAKAKAAKEAAEKEAAEKAAAQKEAMAKFAALKEAATKRYAEKKAQEAKKEKETASRPASTASAPRTPSPKKPPFPTARTTIEEDDAYSFRPYDRPRRPYGGASGSSAYSESSYAPSQSTARTTPPPSHRGTYSTKDPDKIVIHGVYQFNNAFMKTPVAQLVSGQGMVTEGLVLRMTTEGLFIDDDLRGVGQREWDVKAWTLKLAEVWCPQMSAPPAPKSAGSSNPFSFRRGGSAHSVPTNEESDAFVVNLLKVCKNTCRLVSPSTSFARSAAASGMDGGSVRPPQAEFRGLHVLRASLRDQEGKKYVFVLQDTEAWKVAIGLQRLRGGALVRALGVSALPVPDCKSILGGLGYI
ncbi:uncharacterized protein N7459_002805 [Penicillium hispanicum]|uniref:uncharacterized protein n=1 Tax=Penicillium hispanicum TaxID=1080232 RepID=UPI0025414D22|nr:uncharacterized protein N7459_002805 [Penicillium hispanicum]KAJ5587040.1 hypothetical protein N7459_002805 [Penicillium hispanicum]